MLRKRVERLEAHLPVSPHKMLERLDRQAMNALSGMDRELVSEKHQSAGRRRKCWSQDHDAAEARYLDNIALLLQKVSDDDLASLILQIESEEAGHLEATA